MDADIVSRKQLKSGRTLLRFIEQKNKTHKYDGPQRTTLRFIDAIIRHCIECDDAESLRIDPKSGVYIIRGEIAAATTSRRETDFIGDQTIEHVSDPNRRIEITGGRDVKSMLWRFLDPDDYMKTRRNGSS
jgi:hypothetical protein